MDLQKTPAVPAEKTGQITALTYGILAAQHSQEDQNKRGWPPPAQGYQSRAPWVTLYKPHRGQGQPHDSASQTGCKLNSGSDLLPNRAMTPLKPELGHAIPL